MKAFCYRVVTPSMKPSDATEESFPNADLTATKTLERGKIDPVATITHTATPEQLPLVIPTLTTPISLSATVSDRNARKPLRAIALVQPGDLWQLGRHGLLCADCTQPHTLSRLFLPGEKADLLFFDPPYGVRYGRWEGGCKAHRGFRATPIYGDDLRPERLRAVVASALRLAPLKPGGSFYLCSAAGDMETYFRLAVADAGLTLRQALVWVKHAFVFSRQDYHWRHETVLYGWKKGVAHSFYGGRTQDTVWEIKRPLRSHEHPTMKPVALIERAIRNSTLPGAVVYDAFAGSGTTLLACEMTGRTARLMEIEPKHCETILRRWSQLTGQTPVRCE